MNGVKFLLSVLVAYLSIFLTPIYSFSEELHISNLPTGDIITIDTADHPTPVTKRKISGTETLLTGPDVFGMTVYNNELFATNDAGQVLLVFDAETTGNKPPKRKITGLTSPRGVAIVNNEMFVGDIVAGKAIIKIFNLTDSGDATPKRTFHCNFTDLGLTTLWSLVVYKSEIFISDTSKICVFDTNSTGNIRPKRTIQCSTTNFSGAYGLDVYKDQIYISDSHNRIMTFPLNSDGVVAPIRTIKGPNTNLASPYSLIVRNGLIYSAQYSSKIINVFNATKDGDIAPLWHYSNADLTNPWAMAMINEGYVEPAKHQQSGVIVSLDTVSKNATNSTELQTAYNTPEGFDLRAPVGSFTATINSNGANGVFRFKSNNLNGTVTNVKLYKCYPNNSTSISFGSYSSVIDPDTEGAWWLEDESGNYISKDTTLVNGTKYWVNYVVKDNGKYDLDHNLGSIKDPAALGISASSDSSSGCVLNPAANFGLEWLLLAGAALFGIISRFKRN